MTHWLFAAAPLVLSASVAGAEPLPALTLEPGATSVSGLSSGAFMAVQLQVAFSAGISGAGIVAGGPFDCADRSLWRALNVCMAPIFVNASPRRSFSAMEARAAEGSIDPLAGVADDRLYLFHGKADDTVARATMDALAETYDMLGVAAENLTYVTSVEAGHAFITEQGSLTCADTAPDFLNDCDIDQAGDILTQIYGPLSPSKPVRDAGFLVFDQAQYTDGAKGMGAVGFAYIPEVCAAGESCRLHIAIHGCKQGQQYIGETYARTTGFNAWAEANRIVVLYPQAVRIPTPWYNWFGGNPNGCWDWWGYSGSNYLTQTAPQPAAIARMAAALGAPLQD
ncbi:MULTISPECIES: extracellular catalytic domain type 2 short-chain-length polyhydroxyalkanoate depolymerase [unclassified Marinovum]